MRNRPLIPPIERPTQPMTAIDKALEIFRQDTNNQENQSQFFDLFLNTTFFVPIVPEE
jgi:hypothetical protein